MSFSKITIDATRSNPDKIYYNATIINNSIVTTQSTDDPDVTFEDSRQNPIIADGSLYKVSVQNFTMNGATKTLPLFIPVIADPSTDFSTTIYTVSVGVYANSNYYLATAPVIWDTEVSAKFIPTPSLGPVQLESDYYYCYTYSHWVNLVNLALRAAWTDATSQATALGETFGTQCPFMEFNENTGLFSLNQDAITSICPVGDSLPVPYGFTNTNPGGSYVTGEYSFVGMNTNLEGLLTNFPSDYYSTGIEWQTSGLVLPEVVIDMGLTNLYTTSPVTSDNSIGLSVKTQPTVSSFFLTNPFTNDNTGSAYIRLTQDYSSTGSLWSPISSFVLGTTQIPVRNESSSNPILLGESSIGTNDGNSGTFQKVLIEFPINAVTADIWRGWVSYEPLIPTYSSLSPSHESITDLDLQLYWRNRLTNSLNPIRLYNQGTVTFRLLFEKRSV